MGDVIEFKKRKEPMSENAQEIFSELRAFADKKLLPRGFSQSVVDEFLADFEPILISMIPPPIILSEIKENDPNFQAYDDVAKRAQEQINDYILGVIGRAYQREMRHFLSEQLRQIKR